MHSVVSPEMDVDDEEGAELGDDDKELDAFVLSEDGLELVVSAGLRTHILAFRE